MEDFDAGDGLHGLPINRTDDTENTGKIHVIHKNKKTEDVKENVDQYQVKYQISMTAHPNLQMLSDCSGIDCFGLYLMGQPCVKPHHCSRGLP